VQFATLWRVVILGFFCFDQNSGVVSLATISCFLVLSFLQFLFVFFQFTLLLDLVSLAFLKLFFLLAAGSRIFLSF
jgi:hypothetical protein